MDIIAILVVIVVFLFFFKFVAPMKSYNDTPAPAPAVGTACFGTPEAVAPGGNCGCDTDCTGHVSTGAYCSHKSKICKPARG